MSPGLNSWGLRRAIEPACSVDVVVVFDEAMSFADLLEQPDIVANPSSTTMTARHLIRRSLDG